MKQRNPSWPIIRKRKAKPEQDTDDVSENVDWEVVEQAERVRQELKEKRDQMHAWIQGNNDFNSKPLLAYWRTMVKEHRTDILDLVIKVFSITDGVIGTNEVLKFGMNMENASVDLGKVNEVLGKVFIIQATELFARKVGMKPANIKELLTRTIAREFPLKDNRTLERPAPQVIVEAPRNPPQIRSHQPVAKEQATESKVGARRQPVANPYDEG